MLLHFPIVYERPYYITVSFFSHLETVFQCSKRILHLSLRTSHLTRKKNRSRLFLYTVSRRVEHTHLGDWRTQYDGILT